MKLFDFPTENLEKIKEIELHTETDAGELEDRVALKLTERAGSDITLEVSNCGGVGFAVHTVLLTVEIVWLIDTPTGSGWNP